MDFITNMIKRPLSIRLSDASSSSGLSSADPKPKDSPSALASMAVHPVLTTEDLIQLGDPEPLPSGRESIQKLLLDVNVNLSQVSAHEMEHLQAMSAEMSPLAVKQSVRPSLEKQKTLATAMIIPLSEDLAIEPVAPRFGMFDEEKIPELAPLSAEMEAELTADQSDADVFVECMSLNSEKFSCDPSELEAYSSALNDVLEQQLEQTVSDPLAGGIAHNTSYEPMDVDEINETMEMLKDFLAPEDHQLLQQQFLGDALPPGMGQELYHRQQQSPQEGTEVPLEREQSQPQSMPVQEVPQLEKKVPEAEQSVGQCQKQDVPLPAIGLFQENGSTQEQAEQQLPAVDPFQEQKQLSKELEVALPAAVEPPQEPNQSTQEKTAQSQTCQETEQLVKALTMDQMLQEEPQEKTQNSEICQLHDQQVIVHPQEVQFEKQEPKECPVLMNSSHISMENEHEHSLQLEQPQEPEIQTEQVVPSPAEEHLKKPEEPAVAPLSPPIPTLQANRVEYPISPPIPTHRAKTAEELMFLALKEFPLSANEGDLGLDDKATVPEEKKPDQGTVVAVTPRQLQQTTKPLSLELDSSSSNSKVLSTGPNSPSFPIKGPTEQSAHFPRSPHAPAEREEMYYLEEAVSNLSICAPGVIAKSPVTIQVSQPSPEQRHLNETLPMGEVSPKPQDGTFDSGKRIEHSPQNEDTPFQDSPTFAVSLGAADDQRRRTFSVVKSTDDQQEAGESKSRRTFSLEKDKPRRTFSLEKDEPRRTFGVEAHASPAVEATEESMGSEDFEAMDVDVSVQVHEAPTLSSPRTPAQDPKLPLIPTHQNLTRPPIHVEYAPAASHQGNAPAVVEEQALSAKEQAHLSASDEKDVFVEHFGALSPVSDDMFKTPQYTSSGFNNLAKMKSGLGGGGAPTMSLPGERQEEEQFSEEEFQDAASYTKFILNSSDFDYLYTKGSNNAPVDRSSLLLKFDPLLGAPVPVNHPQQQEQALLNVLGNHNLNRALSPTWEEHETSGSSHSFVIESSAKEIVQNFGHKPPVDRTKKHAKMSVDVIDNECNKTFDNCNLNTEDKSHTYNNMDELEKKIKNEVTRSEDIEKKLKDAEQREEALIKRITEKDKTNSKLTGVIEAYEKAIAELISEKEQLIQNYETQLQDVQTDRDANYHHLTSLETTFFDLHVKYEKSKEMTSQLKNSEDTLLADQKQLMENLRLQEQRYEKMRSHAMLQLEIANKKLDTNAREHADEVKKLKALLKKEEVSRVSTTEQLQQKSRENADLLKICEELIYGKGQDF
ncbi:transforming acidic coiled-coil-containing protein 2 isoform X2 [Drosophila miranda]|uniref:transforming acidic coiled-coil-containing protein 2 isoform X2 n=1 Tax=Drosophila miranda TaxID=7229 RepID=UPI0007E87A56|nr:transforming acidic coiled-coil-containing protein 2 isoform X2 [Drosophila miranda]